MIIKVCGLTDNESGNRVAQIAGVDWLGFIFYEGSKRYTSTTLASPKKKVGVFVNASLEFVKQQIKKHQLNGVQLHGSESPEFISKLPKGVQVIKAFGIASNADLESVKPYDGFANYFLFDTKSEQYGGTGKAFNWGILKGYNSDTPFLLSGGIGTESVAALKGFHHPKLAGYDLNSKFEIAPKEKDTALIARFLKEII